MTADECFALQEHVLKRVDLADSAKLLFCRLMCICQFRMSWNCGGTHLQLTGRLGVSGEAFRTDLKALAGVRLLKDAIASLSRPEPPVLTVELSREAIAIAQAESGSRG